jgi:hypothetical protein
MSKTKKAASLTLTARSKFVNCPAQKTLMKIFGFFTRRLSLRANRFCRGDERI